MVCSNKALKDAGIVTVFPLLDLHLDENFVPPGGFNKHKAFLWKL
jgi:hypothetical protein